MSSNQNDIFRHTIQGIFNNNDQLVQRSSKQYHGQGNKINKSELEFALAVLLVDLASCDQNFEPPEYHIIQNGMRRVFGTTKDQVSALINQANQTLKNLRGSGRFATQLKDALTLEQRQIIMQVIEDVIAADGKEDGFETYLRAKFSDLLGLGKPTTPGTQAS